MSAKTLYDKLWDAHLVEQFDDGSALIYIDRHIAHEVTTPQAFEGLKLAGRPLWRRAATVAVPDHNVPTRDVHNITDPVAKLQLESGMPPLDLSEPMGTGAGPHYASDVMVRMPFDELPMAGRFRQLQLAIDRYFSSVAGRAADGTRAIAEQALLQLQAQVMRQMLINWGRMDLFASAVTENRVQADLVSEFRVNRMQFIIRDVLLWLAISAGVAILMVVPAIWAVDHWPLIRQQAVLRMQENADEAPRQGH